MQPTFREGSEVLVSSIPYFFNKPKAGEIVAFKDLGKIMVKRIKKVKGDFFLLEGDNVSDSLKIGWMKKRDIIGKVVFKL